MKITNGIISVAILVGFSGFAQTNYVIQTPVVAADHTVKFRWNSETGAVFKVLSADSLMDVGHKACSGLFVKPIVRRRERMRSGWTLATHSGFLAFCHQYFSQCVFIGFRKLGKPR